MLWRDEPPVTLNAKTQMDLEEVRQTVRKIFDNTQDGGTGDGEGSKKLEEVRKNTLKLVTATAETQIASATLTQILELVERIAAQGDGRQTTADETAAAKPAKPATRDRRRTRREQRTASQKKNRPAPKTKTTADPIDAPTPTTPGGEATA